MQGRSSIFLNPVNDRDTVVRHHVGPQDCPDRRDESIGWDSGRCHQPTYRAAS